MFFAGLKLFYYNAVQYYFDMKQAVEKKMIATVVC